MFHEVHDRSDEGWVTGSGLGPSSQQMHSHCERQKKATSDTAFSMFQALQSLDCKSFFTLLIILVYKILSMEHFRGFSCFSAQYQVTAPRRQPRPSPLTSVAGYVHSQPHLSESREP